VAYVKCMNSSSGGNMFLSCLPISGLDTPTFIYKGICSNPPEITKCGVSRGNYAQLHRKAWLEVSDKYHRYGKNLRMYYKHWEELNHPFNMFFDWLDVKGEAAGNALPNLPGCPRSQLDSDTVRYIMIPEEREKYVLTINICDKDNSNIFYDSRKKRVRTGPDGWIFVLRDGEIYASQKVTCVLGKAKQRFHHSSFFGGKAVAAAGIIITDDNGKLTRLYPHSGHYRPGESHMQRMLYFLQQLNVDLNSFEVDMQQIVHVSREEPPRKKIVTDDKDSTVKRVKKTVSIYLKSASFVACYLAHKAHMIGQGTFVQIHNVRHSRARSVKEVLIAIDDGGFWNRNMTNS